MPRQDAGAAVSVERFFQFSLLGLVASGYLAVAGSGYLDTPTIALTTAGLILRGVLICGLLRLDLSDRLTTIVTIAYAAFFGADYFLLSRDFLAATVHLLFFLAVMKILTAKSNRDYLYTAVIAFLELLAAAILSVNFNFFLFLALYLLFAIAALTSGEIRRSIDRSTVTARSGLKNFYPRLSILSASVTLGILTLTTGLFFILPRTAEAAFSRLIAHRVFLPGFSTQVNLGDIGEIKTSSRPVMHIRIWSAQSVGPMKWRGAALSEFDGKRWSNSSRKAEMIPVENEHVVLAPVGLRPPGRFINYRVDLEALDDGTLFFAGTPEAVDLRARALYRYEGSSFRLGLPTPPGFHYDAFSLLDNPPETAPLPFPPPVLPLASRELYLQLPTLDGRIAELARTFSAGSTSDLARTRSIERRLRSDYAYTLQLPDREVADPLANFLFVRRKGHCEYFASSMAVMLRSIGIPARLATGFQSGVYNPVSDLWLVRASDAHSWVEAWIPGYGWKTFDPTPADPNAGGLGLFTRLALYLDASETFWQEWVVTYDLVRQGTLAYRMEQGAQRLGIRWFDTAASLRSGWKRFGAGWARRFGWQSLVWLAGLVALGFAAGPLLRRLHIRRRVERVRRGQASVADATVLYQRMLHILKRRGYQKPLWFTPAEFAASLPRTPLGQSVGEFTATYNALRFGGHAEAASTLSILLDRMERQ
jgi:transglutaminase-like putative cysteine protease